MGQQDQKFSWKLSEKSKKEVKSMAVQYLEKFLVYPAKWLAEEATHQTWLLHRFIDITSSSGFLEGLE